MTATAAATEVAVTRARSRGFRARLDDERPGRRRTVGVVPTMGALHEATRSLLRRAAAECDVVAVTVFVNPTQFGDASDLDHYPRTLDADLAVAATPGATLVFAPPVDEMYPDGRTRRPPRCASGPGRPVGGRVPARSLRRRGHRGTKLLSAAGPCRTYFGEKDFQQLAVVRRVVRDLSLPVEVVGCATVRGADGLALSSRNVRLSAAERAAAPVAPPGAVGRGCVRWRPGATGPRSRRPWRAWWRDEPLVDLDYAVLVDADDLEPADAADRAGRCACSIAAPVGPVRLIDNLDPRPARVTTVPAVRPGPLDVLVLGSGVAGLSAAVRLAAPLRPAGGTGGGGLRVGVLTKAELSQSATRWAQGGVAAVLGGDEDSTDLHLADTLAAGAGLCDADAVRVLVDEGPTRVHELIAMGAVFDRQPGGALALAREGGHSTARVVHAGGAATGAEVERALVDATRSSAAAVLEEWFALDLLVEGGRCRGVVALDTEGRRIEVRADHTVLATGGAGQVFSVTTNPAEATGDGLAMALRAGVPVADVEFMQFHPTALHHPAMPRPLLSEALRGHGALLRDARGDRFVDELAPRDVVSRAMAERMHDQGVENLWLDATALESFDARFPTISASLAAIGLDPVDRLDAHRPGRPLPVRRRAHRPVGGHRAARPVGGGRGGLHRRPRGQPAGLELVARGHGLRRPAGRDDPGRWGRAHGHRACWPRCSRAASSRSGPDGGDRTDAGRATGPRTAPAVGPGSWPRPGTGCSGP